MMVGRCVITSLYPVTYQILYSEDKTRTSVAESTVILVNEQPKLIGRPLKNKTRSEIDLRS